MNVSRFDSYEDLYRAATAAGFEVHIVDGGAQFNAHNDEFTTDVALLYLWESGYGWGHRSFGTIHFTYIQGEDGEFYRIDANAFPTSLINSWAEGIRIDHQSSYEDELYERYVERQICRECE